MHFEVQMLARAIGSSLRLARASRVPTARAMSTMGSDSIASQVDQQIGRRGAELAEEAKGKDFFRYNTIQGSFGTSAKPVEVPSSYPARIIGCTGGVEGTDAYHDILWMEIEQGVQNVCNECGQVFVLKQD
mmetsp:Transcript_19914/g.39883  ORF Transcript_19914/g.39883 Transcript_19914/m.39883 type:complete len:131 (-) Transcript_19914:28-420(-)